MRDWEIRRGAPAQSFVSRDGEWKATALPSYGRRLRGFDDYRGWVTFRARLPEPLARQQKNQLAIDAGQLSDVVQVYINDELAGGMGSVEPYSTASMMTFVRTVPNAIRLKPDNNYIYLALYTDGTYPLFASEEPRIGNAESILRDYYGRELLSIGLLGIYLLGGLYYLFLWSRRKKDKYHLFFGLLCVLLCSYWFFRLGSRDVVFGNHVLLRSKFELCLLFFIGPVFSFFLSQFFHGGYDRIGLVLSACCGILALVAAFGSYRIAFLCLAIWQVGIMPVIAYYIFYIFREFFRKNQDAMYLVPGVAALLLGAIHDILAIRGVLSTPMIARFAFPVFILGGALVLTRRFTLVHTQVEELLGNAVRLENFRTELLSIDPRAGINELLERILVVLGTLFGSEKAFAIVPDKFGALHFTQELPEEIRSMILWGNRLQRRAKISTEFFENYGSILHLGTLRLEPSSPVGKQHLVSLRATELVFQKVAELGYQIAIALPHESEVLGMIFLGAKSNKTDYSESELSLIKTFQYSITQVIRNKMLFSEISQLKGEAEERVEKLSEYVIERRNAFQVEVDEKTI
ncbi:MAG: 7TM-DISM domain-containing protein, partial [Spirochaetia bacterium]|nr:7TM-DISM domain-containing protein [Spirochaetia bacterium]